MIQLRQDIKLPDVYLKALLDYQQEVDSMPTHTERCEKAKQLFNAKNTRRNPAFREVRKHLAMLCNATRRCVYCEDSIANQVEHIAPKDFYPEKCFDWDNYVFACGPCNAPKNNLFAVFKNDSGAFHRVNTPNFPNNIPPPQGSPVMINPRIENPLNFCILDLSATFLFYPLPGLSDMEKIRAEYTFYEVLKMNEAERDPLRVARSMAYENYKDALYSFIKKKGRRRFYGAIK